MTSSDSPRLAPTKEATLQAKRAETGEYLATCALVDLNGYLTDALTQVLLAKVKLSGESEAEAHIARTSKILQGAGSMTQQILGSQPPSSPNVELLNLNQIIRKAGRSFLTWSPENIDLQLKLVPTLPPVPGNRIEMERLIICLLVNMALMSESETQVLTVSTQGIPQATVVREAWPIPSTAIGHVGDAEVFEPGIDDASQGPPWPPPSVGAIAFRFYLTHHAVKHQQGLLSVKQLRGDGIRVTVRFPAADANDSFSIEDRSTAQSCAVMLEMTGVPADSSS